MITLYNSLPLCYNEKHQEVFTMAQSVNVNFRMDEQLKKNVEEICQRMGMNLTLSLVVSSLALFLVTSSMKECGQGENMVP